MAEVTFVATVDESRVLHLPPEVPLGRVEVVVREEFQGNSAALLEAIRRLPPRTPEDVKLWREAREELYRDREAWDED